MQCPQCGFSVGSTDTFCEKCGVVFADYRQIQAKKNQTKLVEAKSIPDTKISIQQQELTAKFLCNSEGCAIAKHHTKEKKLFVKPVAKSSSNKEEKDFFDFLVKILAAITILAVIFFVYFFIII